MSTRVSRDGPVKKISSWVRPGVCEMRASARRPVSALIRLDLPTLERPAMAASMPRIGGSAPADPAAAANRQSPANSLRPASMSAEVNSRGAATRKTDSRSVSVVAIPPLRGVNTKRERDLALRLLLGERSLEIVPQLDLGAVLVHDHALLDHRERVVPGPVDHQPGREARQHECEDDRHVVED